MSRHWILFKTVLKRNIIEMRRYYVDTIGYVINYYLIFIFLFIGYKSLINNVSFTAFPIEGVVIKYIFWLFSVGTLAGTARFIIQESRAGTLEQIYMTPLGFNTIIFYCILADFITQLIYIIPVFFLVMLTIGKLFFIDLLTFGIILFLTVLSGYGIGLIIGGISLIYKNALAIARNLQFVYIGIISLSVNSHFLIKFLPFTLGTNMALYTFNRKLTLLNFSLTDILILVFTSMFYLFLGFYILHICEKIAKNKGVLGHY
jgi:ABC-2 type transport system permease protein